MNSTFNIILHHCPPLSQTLSVRLSPPPYCLTSYFTTAWNLFSHSYNSLKFLPKTQGFPRRFRCGKSDTWKEKTPGESYCCLAKSSLSLEKSFKGVFDVVLLQDLSNTQLFSHDSRVLHGPTLAFTITLQSVIGELPPPISSNSYTSAGHLSLI